MNNKPVVWCIVLNWNGGEDTVRCLASLLISDYNALHVLMIDNGSTDGSVDRVTSTFGTISVLALGENLGFCRGVNIGIGKAIAGGAGAVLLINNDAVVERNTISELVRIMNLDQTYGIVGPVVRVTGTRKLWSAGDRISRWSPVPLKTSEADIDRAKAEGLFVVDYIAGCVMLIRRELINTVGLINERFDMYYEDSDYCRRSKRAGFQVVLAPRVGAFHKVSRAASRVPARTLYLKTRNRFWFYRTYGHGLRPLLGLAYSVAVWIGRLVLIILSGRWSLISPAWAGLVDGLGRQ